MRYKFCYDKLLGKITEVCRTRENFAKAIGISGTSLQSKLSGRTEFKQSEIATACEVLSIDEKDIPLYFFA